jgi:hypothetical protein
MDMGPQVAQVPVSTHIYLRRAQLTNWKENENGNKQDLRSEATLPGETEGGPVMAQNTRLVQIPWELNNRPGGADGGALSFGQLQQAQATPEATENSGDLEAPSAMIRQDVSGRDSRSEAAKLSTVQGNDTITHFNTPSTAEDQPSEMEQIPFCNDSFGIDWANLEFYLDFDLAVGGASWT